MWVDSDFASPAKPSQRNQFIKMYPFPLQLLYALFCPRVGCKVIGFFWLLHKLCCCWLLLNAFVIDDPSSVLYICIKILTFQQTHLQAPEKSLSINMCVDSGLLLHYIFLKWYNEWTPKCVKSEFSIHVIFWELKATQQDYKIMFSNSFFKKQNS